MKKLILVMLAGSMIGCTGIPYTTQQTGYVRPTGPDSLQKIDSLEWVQNTRLSRHEDHLWTLAVILVLYSLVVANLILIR